MDLYLCRLVLLYPLCQQQFPSGIKKHMRRLSCIVVDHMEVASEMGGISKRISKVIRDMQSFGVQQMIVDGGEYSHPLQERQREMRHTFPRDNETNFVGLEQNVNKLVGYMVGEESIQVVSIIGMGGIGKTTLARQVFNHEMIKKHFDRVVWVCVSQHFTRKYVWETILQRLSSKDDEHRESNMTEDELQNKLFRMLETSNSLVVLDDMWKEEDWDRIKPVFPPTKGWKVLLTSRKEGVAFCADPTSIPFKLQCLTPEESWTLFRHIAFPRKNTAGYKVDVEMVEMGKKMIKHCGGLPLAIKVLGGLLAAQNTILQWKRVYENIGSHIIGARASFNDTNPNSVDHVLSLSFEDLPISLKHCFLYLAHFPEDFAIDVGKLSYYWAAEEIPKPEYRDIPSVREVADGYVEELVKRNMVISERDILTSKFETCHLHDMMREFFLRKAKEENFLQIVHSTSITNSKSPCKSRRVSIHWHEETYHLEGEKMNPKLRSLLFIKGYRREVSMSSDLFIGIDVLQLIKVLDLSGIKFEGGKLPSSIGKLIHLKYLSLCRAQVSHLPSSMRNLKNLLYLNLLVAGISPLYVPNILNKMQELRYLSFPRKIHDKVKLELGDLTNLETLMNFSTGHGRVRDLQGMTRLRDLSIYMGGEGYTIESLSSSLSELRHLENLTINDFEVYCPTNGEKGFVWDFVNLKKLSLTIYMPRLPDEQHLPRLLHLKEIELWHRSFCGRRMVCSAGGFIQLQKLYIHELEEWEDWIVGEGSMPLLHNLTIHKCQKLKELPDGLRYITSLKELIIYSLGWEWKKKLVNDGEDYYKVKHIPFVRIY